MNEYDNFNDEIRKRIHDRLDAEIEIYEMLDKTKKLCLYKNCENKTLKNSNYCLKHFPYSQARRLGEVLPAYLRNLF